MRLILLWALVGLIGRVRCKCSLAPILDDEQRPIPAYACTHGDLSDLDEISEEAEWIEFTASRLQNIPDDAFQRFKRLRRLSFYNCHVYGIANDAFRGLDRLDWLIFHGTRIYVVRTTWFRYLTNLRKLILDRCGLIHIEPDIFRQLPVLETLSLRDNDLDCLPIEELDYLRSLKTIRIDGNPWLCNCRGELETYFNQRSIVREEERYTKVHYPRRSIQCMLQLERPLLPTYLSPAEIEMFERRRLKIPTNQFQTSVLTSLDRLPDTTTRIEISNLGLDRIPQYTFFRFGNSLRILGFRDCYLNYIEPNAFAGLHKLECLSLTGNNFVAVGADWFRDLIGLQQLILRRNNIESFERTTFQHLTHSLRHLDIRDNRLRCLDVEELQAFRRLERLDATGNPWTCECRDNLESFLISRRIGYEIGAGSCYRNDVVVPINRTQSNITIQTTVPANGPGMVHWTTYTETVVNETSMNTSITVTGGGGIASTVPPTFTTARPPTRVNDTGPPVRGGKCRLEEREPGTRELIYVCSSITSIEALRRIPENVAMIRIFRANLPEIRAWSFARFGGHLRKLELIECNIKTLHPGAFAGLQQLEFLSLQGNFLELIIAGHLRDLTRLMYLDLSQNQINRIDNEVFDMLPYLVSFDVSYNNMNCIGVEHMARRMPRLKVLHVLSNPWSCLCATKLANFLDSRRMPYDRNELFNRLTECYSTPGGRPTIPNIPSIPTSTPVIPTFEPTFKPTYEPGITIPPSYNITPTYPTVVTGICTAHEEESGIRYKCSGGNILLFKTIPNPARVTAIEFYDGNLPVIPEGFLYEFHNLRELAIRNCGVRTIETGAFRGLNNLRHLTIQDNPLTVIESSWFDLPYLETLDLRGNSIGYIAAGSFHNLQKLTRLNLEGNDLKCIFTSDLNEMPNVHTVDFGGNALRWRCRADLEQFLEARKIAFVRIEESCEGKKIMRNILYENRTDLGEGHCSTGCSGTTNLSSSSSIVLVVLACLSLFATIRPTLQLQREIVSL